MAITFLGQRGAYGTSGSAINHISPASNIAAGSLLLFCTGTDTPGTITDTKGNTWHKDVQNSTTCIYSTITNAALLTTDVISFTFNIVNAGLYEFGGVATSSYLDTTANYVNPNGTSAYSENISAAVAGELLIAYSSNNGNAGNPGITPGTQVAPSILTSNAHYVVYNVCSSAGTQTVNVAVNGSIGGGSNETLLLALYKPVVPDTTAPVPNGPSLAADGVTLTLPWTEASGTVVQNGGATLTLTASGGAVTLSGVTTAGTTTTATASRTISSTETLSLAGSAAGWQDPSGNATAAFTGLAVTNNSTQVFHPIVSAPKHVFSTGTLVANWTDGMGVAQSATFAVLQDISTDLTFTRKDLFDAQANSIFPIDCADSEGKLVLKASQASISADCLQRLIAATLTGAAPGSTAQLVLPKEVKLPAFQAVLTLYGTDGKSVILTAGAAKALGASLALKLADFAVNSFELHCYPDNSGVIATWAFAN